MGSGADRRRGHSLHRGQGGAWEHLGRKTAFLFYSESGLGEDAAAMLEEAGVLVLDPAKLARFEGA